MALDHYISRVYLKNFYSPKLKRLMYAIRKSDLKEFTPDAYSVCRIEEGSTNAYLSEPRVIEDFLKGIEPKYNSALQKIHSNQIDLECIYVISGFIAYINACAPASMRIFSEAFKHPVEEITRIVDNQGKIPKLRNKSITDLLDNGDINLTVDPKYPQAIGVSQIYKLTKIFGNSSWDILFNPFTESPFFTSDFPIVPEETNAPFDNKIIPLSPQIAIRIYPNLKAINNSSDVYISKLDFDFSDFKYTIYTLKRQEVLQINRLIVRCANELVFFRDRHNWIYDFIKKNASYSLEPVMFKRKAGNKTLIGLTIAPVKK